MSVEELYRSAIRSRSLAEQRELIKLIALGLGRRAEDNGRKRRLAELEGLGAELWAEIDPQQYVNRLRSEWDERPWTRPRRR